MKSTRAISVLEMLLALVILLVALAPLVELMITTTKGTKLTRDYLIAYNLAQLAFEQVVHHATQDNAGSFEDAIGKYAQAESQTAPNGCPGASFTSLGTGAGDPVLPDDGDPRFNVSTGDPDYVNIYKRYSYSMKITASPAGADAVVTPDSKAALARVDVKVYWKGEQGSCQSIRYSDYFARRRY